MSERRRRFGGGLNGLALRNPEQLWIQCSFVICMMFALVTSAYLMNQRASDRSLASAKVVMAANQTLDAAQRVLSGAEGWNPQSDPDAARLRTTIRQLGIRANQLANHVYARGGAQIIDPGEFAQLRQDLTALSALGLRIPMIPEDRMTANTDRMRAILTGSGIEADLLAVADAYAADIAAITQLRRTSALVMLVVTLATLIASAVFVYLPAQRAVTRTLDTMRRRTADLRASQTRLTQLNSQLGYLVKHDPLTKLPNRSSLTLELDQCVQSGRCKGMRLYLVSLNDFKSVNDTMGQDVGDAVLIAVAAALQSCLNYDDYIARVGGDEFVLLSTEDAGDMVQRLQDALRSPFEIGPRKITVKASIGHTDIDTQQAAPMSSFGNAEIALKAARAEGRTVQAYSPNLRLAIEAENQRQRELHDALANGEIEPWFQPQIRLCDGTLYGAEVLARWRHPEHGILTPIDFLASAEAAGLIVDLDHCVWQSAIGLAVGWQRDQLWQPRLSFNAAPATICDPQLVERFLLALNKSGLSPEQVVVEVLETTLITGNEDLAAINIDTLAECGIALELDDFGTGYASLSKLTQLPLAGLKMDRSLVAPLPDQRADSIVRAILALAAELGLHVIAEGIEDQAQACHLRQRGCGYGQGYGFAKPMPPEAFAKWLSTHGRTDGTIALPMLRTSQQA